MTSGLLLVGGCFIIAELCQTYIRKRMYKKRKPYEWQYIPAFFILFCTLFLLQHIAHFPPMLNIFLKFGLLYSGIGIALLLILFCMRYIHYQSYIFILNWLNRDDKNRLT
ncbi:putative membrane protein [Bacillus clarus]|nr:putative membrane protein [Bacillus clarus]